MSNFYSSYKKIITKLIDSNDKLPCKKKKELKKLLSDSIHNVENVENSNDNVISKNVFLLDNIKLTNDINRCNDCWGYSVGNKMYALMGHVLTLEIYEIKNNSLLYITSIPHNQSMWSDVKTYETYCYCVNENDNGDNLETSGLQIISLKDIENGTKPSIIKTINSVEFNNNHHDSHSHNGNGSHEHHEHEKINLNSAHNVYVDEKNGILYVLGVRERVTQVQTDGGRNSSRHPNSGKMLSFALKQIDGLEYTKNASPESPVYIPIENDNVNKVDFNNTYYHDFYTYTYTMSNNKKKVIAYGSAEDNGISVIDVTIPNKWVFLVNLNEHLNYISKQHYNVNYSLPTYLHQLWSSYDGRYIFANDEFLLKQCVIVYDMQEMIRTSFKTTNAKVVTFKGKNMLQNPPNEKQLKRGMWTNGTDSINHNLYVHYNKKLKCDFIFHSCYTTGLRIFAVKRNDSKSRIDLIEVAYYDTFPKNSDPIFDGQWSNYYFNNEENVCIATDISNGDYLLQILWDGIEKTLKNVN